VANRQSATISVRNTEVRHLAITRVKFVTHHLDRAIYREAIPTTHPAIEPGHAPTINTEAILVNRITRAPNLVTMPTNRLVMAFLEVTEHNQRVSCPVAIDTRQLHQTITPCPKAFIAIGHSCSRMVEGWMGEVILWPTKGLQVIEISGVRLQ